MRLFEWLLKQIESNPEITERKESARRWIARQQPLLGGIHRRLEITGHATWNDDWKAWRRNVRVLQRVMEAIRRKETIGGLEEHEALRVIGDHLGKLRLVLTDSSPASAFQDWRTTSVMIVPTDASGDRSWTFETLDVFWQMVFASLFHPTRALAPVCRECGTELPPTTPTGQPSRKTICARCSTRTRRAKLPDARRRAENRRHQQAYRARLRNEKVR